VLSLLRTSASGADRKPIFEISGFRLCPLATI